MPYPKKGDLVEIVGGKSGKQRAHIGKNGTVLRIRGTRWSNFKCFWTAVEGVEREIRFSGNDLQTIAGPRARGGSNPWH